MNKKKRIKYVVANFKMNLTSKFELDRWFKMFIEAKKKVELSNARVVLCPPVVHLSNFLKRIKSKSVEFGSQDCFWEQKGAFTGETSPSMIYGVGGKYVILGHSERRKYLGETNEMIADKIVAALKVGLIPILCIGENATEKKNDAILEVINQQLAECLKGVSRSKMEKVILCYEPIWAISANKPDHLPTSDEIMGAKLIMKKSLVNKFGRGVADKVSILYGGSVKSDNLEEVCIDSGVDGVLVGGLSLLPYELIKVAKLLEG